MLSCNNVTHHPMNPDADVTYQTVNLFNSGKCFIYFISDVPHYIWSNQHNTICTVLVKIDVLDTCGAMICSYFGITFLLFFMKIENTVYTSFQSSTCLFFNELIFDIMNITSLLNLNEYQCYHHLDLSMIKGFHGFVMFSVFPILFSNAKETLQKMLVRKCSYHVKQMKDWK